MEHRAKKRSNRLWYVNVSETGIENNIIKFHTTLCKLSNVVFAVKTLKSFSNFTYHEVNIN